MQPKVIVLTVAVLLFVVTGMILVLRTGTTTPTAAIRALVAVPDDRSATDLIINATSLAIEGELHTLYQVKRGDTLFRISQKFGVSTQAIKDANKDKSDLLKVDQWLAIPK